jgi:N-acetylglucosamine-6-phosphate deacetylase
MDATDNLTAPGSAAPQLRLRVGRIALPDGVLEDGVVSVRDGRIAEIAPAGAGAVATHHFPHAVLLPGAIDVHVHGCGGWRIGAEEAQDEALDGMGRALARTGVTSFLPTIATTLDEIAKDALRAIARRMRDQAGASPPRGAHVVGSHLEGPYLNPRRKGAMREDRMRAPDLAHFETLWTASEGTVRYLTLAPELDGAERLVQRLRELGVFVSAGHTDALASQLHTAIAFGVQGVTHLFNAMRGLHHREPGVVGAALAAPDLWIELIGDGVHVHPDVMRLVLRLKGPERVAIVSDTGRYAGMPSGRYEEPERTIVVDDVRCSFPDGTLAGSASPMHRNLLLLHRDLGLGWSEIARISAANPATMLGIDGDTGRIEAGKLADLIVLGDDGQIHLTLVRGRPAYVREEEGGEAS